MLFLLYLSSLCLSVVGEQTFNATVLPFDLSLPPSQRWTGPLNHFGGKAAGAAVSNYFLSLVRYVPKEALDMIEIIAGDLDKYGANIPLELREEMRAISAGAGIPLGTVVALNYIYALRNLGPRANTTGPLPPGACTSIVGTRSTDGVPIHVRNLDWDLPNPVRNLSFLCNVMRDGKVLFQGACFLGFVGMASASRPGSFGITVNERAEGGELLMDILTAVLRGAWDPTHALRQAMTVATDFESAVETLRGLHLASPVYYIASGPARGNGVVLTRDRIGMHSERWLNASASTFYVGQTNYDWDKSAPSYDDRRKYMLEYLNALGVGGVSRDSLWGVISKWPVLNVHSAYTTVMIPHDHVFDLYIRLKPNV